MKAIPEADTSYNDAVGDISMTFRLPTGFYNEDIEGFASSLGVDIRKHNPIGLRLHGPGGYNKQADDPISVSIYAIDKEKYPRNVFPMEPIPVVELKTEIPLIQLFRSLKGFDAVLFKSEEYRKRSEVEETEILADKQKQ